MKKNFQDRLEDAIMTTSLLYQLRDVVASLCKDDEDRAMKQSRINYLVDEINKINERNGLTPIHPIESEFQKYVADNNRPRSLQ